MEHRGKYGELPPPFTHTHKHHRLTSPTHTSNPIQSPLKCTIAGIPKTPQYNALRFERLTHAPMQRAGYGALLGLHGAVPGIPSERVCPEPLLPWDDCGIAIGPSKEVQLLPRISGQFWPMEWHQGCEGG